MSTGDDTAKLNSLFKKKKKKGPKSLNANATVMAQAASNTTPAAAAASAAPTKPVRAVADLNTSAKEEEQKASFQWSKNPKKYKEVSTKEAVAKTWEEQEQRNRSSRKMNLESEKAFPTLGKDASTAKLTSKQVPQASGVKTQNAWASLRQDDEDSD